MNRSLIDIGGIPLDEIDLILDLAEELDASNGRDSLAGKSVVATFLEPSTRTRTSFEIATKRLGADFVDFDSASSSLVKGESLRDTFLTIAAMRPDAFVIRHQNVGVPDRVTEWTGIPVINAGDGRRGHPTQTLADLLTLRRHCPPVDQLHIGIVGDVANSRVARGLLSTLPRMGARVVVVGPTPFLPSPGEWDIDLSSDLDEILPKLDVVYALRVQKERGAGDVYPSDSEYHRRFGIDEARILAGRPELKVLHPGPFNRGVELADDVADGNRSLILEQVSAGVAVRMAVLEWTLGNHS